MSKARDLANLGSNTAALATDAEVSASYVANAIVDAKGDLIVGSAADTPARLAVGANGKYLKANSAAATGVEWADVAVGKNFTSLATANVAAGSASYTLSGISGVDHIRIGYRLSASANPNLFLRFNGDTGANYYFAMTGGSSGTTSLNLTPISTDTSFYGFIDIIGANGSGLKTVIGTVTNDGATRPQAIMGWWTGTATVSSFTLIASTGTLGSANNFVHTAGSA